MASSFRPASNIFKVSSEMISATKLAGNLSRSFPCRYSPSTRQSYMRVAAFHTSGSKTILPPLPQMIQGTANDAAPVPNPEPNHGSYHWTFERLISAGLVPLTLAPFAAGSLNPALDAVLCATILIHSHIGFESVLTDYVPKKRLPKTRAVSWWALRAATVAVGVGLYEFETNDVGVTEAIKRIWRA
ncbi:succinate dehydrogenase membrane anchor subunit / SDH4 [Blumeria hordei DH14]|uniref:Succinate dehydrogenase [ubiquinone] cytochrome b small subunit n=1 Tax=Blumeria graminis f. sp. hordei (strain DH14) TaxID=546991 RepID=N1JIS1_BLUG1|nr:succinate dehydrogenase membrane anchor subunit / SDH4 [Blumeria hordei DH14]